MANEFSGTYAVTAEAADAGSVAFVLTNLPIPPTVVGLQAIGDCGPRTAIVLTFSKPMDVARAQDPANYRLVWAGPDQRLGTPDDQVIRVRRARYNPATQAVTLQLARRSR